MVILKWLFEGKHGPDVAHSGKDIPVVRSELNQFASFSVSSNWVSN